MCRLLSFIPSDPATDSDTLTQFAALSACGVTPPEAPPGHRDGWGLVGFHGTATYGHTRGSHAADDGSFSTASKEVLSGRPSLILAHLRKARIGLPRPENSQPFLADGIAFCHNGTVQGTIPLSRESERQLAGDTDSERLFGKVLERTDGSLAEQVRRTVRHVRHTLPYSAMNLIVTDGSELVAVREAYDLEGQGELAETYYTLYYATDADGSLRAVCSEPLGTDGVTWSALPNHHTLTARLSSSDAPVILPL